MQTILILGLGHLLFNVPYGSRLPDLLAGTLLFIGASLSLGLVLSTIAKSQLQATQMTVFVLLPSILLSGFMFPYEGMPEIAQYIAEIFPATHFMRMVRGFVLRDASLIDLHRDALWMFGFFVLGMTVAAFRFKKRLD
ncbi:ABC transporter permease [Roseibium salinum]|nr:ABC transporter permease [Roseibium salinum]